MTPDADVLVGRRDMADWTITVRYTAGFRIGLWVGLWFIRLGIWLMGCQAQMEEEPDDA